MNKPLKKTLYAGVQYELKMQMEKPKKTICELFNVARHGFLVNGDFDFRKIDGWIHYYRTNIHVDFISEAFPNSIDSIVNFKPILFSLNQLTKPITIGGETFVPIQRMYNMTYGEVNAEWIKQNNILNAPYHVVEMLIENHFNIFNLPSESFIKAEEGNYY